MVEFKSIVIIFFIHEVWQLLKWRVNNLCKSVYLHHRPEFPLAGRINRCCSSNGRDSFSSYPLDWPGRRLYNQSCWNRWKKVRNVDEYGPYCFLECTFFGLKTGICRHSDNWHQSMSLSHLRVCSGPGTITISHWGCMIFFIDFFCIFCL